MTNRNRNKKNKALTKKHVNQNEEHKESGKEEKRLNAKNYNRYYTNDCILLSPYYIDVIYSDEFF